jgi:hypothetical protein
MSLIIQHNPYPLEFWEVWDAQWGVDETTDFDWTGRIQKIVMRQATAGKKPTFNAIDSKFGNMPSVENVSGDILSSVAAVDLSFTSALSVFIVASHNTAANTLFVLHTDRADTGSDGFEMVYVDSAGQFETFRHLGDVGASTRRMGANSPQDTSAHVLIGNSNYSLSTNEALMWVDETQGATQANNSDNTDSLVHANDNLHFFDRPSVVIGGASSIAFLGLMIGSSTGAQRTTFQTWSARYGIGG